jgi:hypothetical protein
MDRHPFHICVLGAGCLAAAVRVQLRLADLIAGDATFASGETAFFLACSDFENTLPMRALRARARADRATVLFSSLLTTGVRIGPFVSSHGEASNSLRYLTRSWDFGLNDIRSQRNLVAHHTLTPSTDRRTTGVAQIGATLVVRELAKLLLEMDGIPSTGCVIKNDSPFDAGRKLPLTGDRWGWRRWWRVWHPATPA